VPADQVVSSPTFDLVHELQGRVRIVHADLYRLDDAAELEDVGLRDAAGGTSVVVAEWALRFASELCREALIVTLERPAGQSTTRRFTLAPLGERGALLVACLRATFDRGAPHGRRCPAA
jgi:tRNA threonylcarbamoyladenosine biosynthesis protein TsaE